MSDTETDPTVHLDLVETCVNLSHKNMYVMLEHMHRGLVDDSSTTRCFWCVVSQDERGPDRQGVTPGDCSRGRPCHESA